MKPSHRRRIIFAASGLCLSLVLAACGERADSPGAQAGSAFQGSAATTHDVTDAADRKLRVPQSPQRVVALSEIDLDSLLALDLAPAGATDGRGSDQPPAYLGERTHGIASVGNFAQPSVDRILMLQPDLILAGGHPDPQLLAQLNAIAPTAVSFRVGEPWQASFERIATLVGRRDRADAFLARHRERVLGLRARLREHEGESVSIVRLSPNGPMAMLGDAFAGRVLAELGFIRPPAQRAAGAGHAPPLSRELLADIDGDWLFIGNFTPDPQSVAALRSEPAFASLAAARAGHVREVDAMLWTVIGGPIAAEAVLDDVERTLLPAASAVKASD